jgi:hypothetical protein
MNRKIRMGMVGGGRGAFIGAVHRMAAALDGQACEYCRCGLGEDTPAGRASPRLAADVRGMRLPHAVSARLGGADRPSAGGSLLDHIVFTVNPSFDLWLKAPVEFDVHLDAEDASDLKFAQLERRPERANRARLRVLRSGRLTAS